MVGAYKTDIGKLAYVGKQGVLCLMSESLYADKAGFTSPKHRTADAMSEILSSVLILINLSYPLIILFRLENGFSLSSDIKTYKWRISRK